MSMLIDPHRFGGVAPADPYYDDVILLLHGDGVDTGTTITDSGPHGWAAKAAVGSVTTSATQKKFGDTSIRLYGSGRYLTYPSLSPALLMEGGSFTIDGWVYLKGLANVAICSYRSDSASVAGWSFEVNSSGAVLFRANFGGTWSDVIAKSSDGLIAATTWAHVAVDYDASSSTVRTYVDGVLAGTTTVSGALTYGSNNPLVYLLAIGSAKFDAGENAGDGSTSELYLDDLRITDGVARYAGTGFSVPTSAYPGGTAFDPDDVSPDADFASVSLLLHCDGSNGGTTFTDSSSGGKSITVVGSANTSTAQPFFGTAAAYFDGTGDVLHTPDHASLRFGSDAFTVEMFVYAESGGAGTERGVYCKRDSGGYREALIYVDSANKMQLLASVNGTSWGVVAVTAVTIPHNTWMHVAAVRNGSAFTLFINGRSCATASNAGTLYAGTEKGTVGALGSSADRPFRGYIDEVRITKGVARYTAQFLPPVRRFADTS